MRLVPVVLLLVGCGGPELELGVYSIAGTMTFDDCGLYPDGGDYSDELEVTQTSGGWQLGDDLQGKEEDDEIVLRGSWEAPNGCENGFAWSKSTWRIVPSDQGFAGTRERQMRYCVASGPCLNRWDVEGVLQ